MGQVSFVLHCGKAEVVSLKANHQSTAVPSPSKGLKETACGSSASA